jgi:hypothetical protein
MNVIYEYLLSALGCNSLSEERLVLVSRSKGRKQAVTEKIVHFKVCAERSALSCNKSRKQPVTEPQKIVLFKVCAVRTSDLKRNTC